MIFNKQDVDHQDARNSLVLSVAAKRFHPALATLPDIMSGIFCRGQTFKRQSLSVITGLADGGDMMLAKWFMDNFGGESDQVKLISAIPFAIENYQQSIQDKALFQSLLNRSAIVFTGTAVYLAGNDPISKASRSSAYRAQANYLITHGDILLAVADENEPVKAGGTLETMGNSLLAKVPVLYISLSTGLVSIFYTRDEFDDFMQGNDVDQAENDNRLDAFLDLFFKAG